MHSTHTPIHMAHGFLRSAKSFPNRPALFVKGTEYTYAELEKHAARLANCIKQHTKSSTPFGLVLAHRSLTALAALLGILMSGRGYVPLHPAFPASRNRNILSLSGADFIVVGEEAHSTLPELLDDTPPLTVLLPDAEDASELAARFPSHTFLARPAIFEASEAAPELASQADATAYLLFTSGSTGTPKGVPVSHANGCAFARYIAGRYEVNEHDRISLTSDLTFDFSVQQLFMPWERGACVCVLPDTALMAPAKFIQIQEITIWISVPSVVQFAEKLRLLKPNAFPSIRLSMFCGEPLSAHAAQAWMVATPSSELINLYGPTEAAVAITQYPWNSSTSPKQCEDGIAPIGWVFETQTSLIVSPDLTPVPDGETGELLLSGSQVTKEYFNAPERTAKQYVTLPDAPGALWYRTGDLVRRGPDGCMFFKGRADDQVQIRGYRVALQEVACTLKKVAGTDLAAILAWPVSQGRADAVYGFVAGNITIKESTLIAACREQLPHYMVPKAIIKLDSFPLSPNGKIDKKALTAILEEYAGNSASC